MNKVDNIYFKNNPEFWNFLNDLVYRTPKGYSVVLHAKSNRNILDWIDSVVVKLKEQKFKYSLATKICWILNGFTEFPKCVRPTCENYVVNTNVESVFLGYICHYCSIECRKLDETISAKRQKSRFEHFKNGYDEERHHQKMIEKYGVDEFFKSDEFKQKASKTILENYGVSNVLSHDSPIRKKLNAPLITAKGNDTKRKNGTFTTSRSEEKAFLVLCAKFGEDDVIRQFRSERYPFFCDFYVKSIDTFIEFQGSWTHGPKPFDANDDKCIELLEKWKEGSAKNQLNHKKNDFYKTAVYVWTDLDPRKRETATTNNLKFLEFFTLDQLQKWICEN